MNLVVTQRALRDIERCARWWVSHRDARGLFAEELDEALTRIRQDPLLGAVYRVVRGREQRRVLMPKTAHHVYFRVDGEDVIGLTVWGARRGRPPSL